MTDEHEPASNAISIVFITTTGSEVDNSNISSNMTHQPSKKVYPQKFREAWMKEPIFAPWLARSPLNKFEAKCHVCNRVLRAKRSDLLQHEKTVTHQEQMVISGRGINAKIQQLLHHKGSIKRAELRYVLDIVEHGRSFNSCDHYVDTIRNGHVECNCPTIQNLKVKPTKIRAIIKNVINKAIIERVANILRHTFFSVFIDENTDSGNSKNFAILARYIHENKIHNYVLEYISIKSGTADILFKCFEYALAKHNIPIKNVVGISSSNADVMVGKHQSFVTLFKKRNPEVVTIPCICQKLNLIAIQACQFIPDNVNKLMHRIFNYTEQSGKRKLELVELQMFASTHTKLEASETQWLSIRECVAKLLEQWPILLIYFEGQNNAYATEIFVDLNSPYTKAYLEFLNYSLKIITRYNTIFQSKQANISTMVEQCHDLLKDLGCNYLKLNIVHNVNLHEVDPYNEGNLLPLNEMNIGCKSKSTISECVKSEKVKQFYTNCQNFYQAAFKSAVDMLPFDDMFLRSLKFLHPSVALDLQKHENHIENILQKFKSKFDDEVVLQEWYFLGFLEEKTKSALLSLSVYDFWIKMIEISNNRAQKFKNICKLALLCLTLPNSNTEIEKLFSLVNNIKSRNRNRLGHRMVGALCRISMDLNSIGSKCCNYPITEEILKNFNSRMYEEDIVPHELNDIIVQDQMSSDDDIDDDIDDDDV
nr:SCAN domain-containing protein 3-like isoform X1 [Megalopta genalis]